MPQTEAIKKIEESQAVQKERLSSLEKTYDRTLAPLLDKMDKLTTSIHENSQSINLQMQKSALQADASKEDVARLTKRQDALDKSATEDRKKILLLNNEVIENRPVLNAVKGLGNKLLLAAFLIVAAAVAVIMSK